MKYLMILFLLAATGLTVSAQSKDTAKAQILKKKIVEISCGECMFKMKGDDCTLAIKLNGKSYFVDGRGIDDFGDAHDEQGFCNAIRKAKVSGKIVNGRFHATSIQLLPFKSKKGK